MYVEKEIEKIYYSIGELATMLHVPQSAIRFWEVKFDMAVKRNWRGIRKFHKEEVEKIKQIHHLLKVEGYTIAGAKRKLKV